MERRRAPLALTALVLGVAAAALPSGAGAVHESHHPDVFTGRTSQDERFLLRVLSHTRVGFRVRWRARCEAGGLRELTRFRKVPVGREGRFRATRGGVALRGKIGYDAQGRPAFPEPFSFANNEARGRVRAVLDRPGHGTCQSGVVSWRASR